MGFKTKHIRDGELVDDVFQEGDVVKIVSDDGSRSVVLSYSGVNASNPLYVASQVKRELEAAYQKGCRDQARRMRDALLIGNS